MFNKKVAVIIVSIHREWELVVYLPSWILIYFKTLYNKPLKEALGLRMSLSFLSAGFIPKEQFCILCFLFSNLASIGHCMKSVQIQTFFLVRIFLYSDWIQENMDQKKLSIWTLFTQWVSSFSGFTQFVLHCLEKQKIALGSDLSGITSWGKGLFLVLSFTNN